MEESFGHYYKRGKKDQMFCLWRNKSYELTVLQTLGGKCRQINNVRGYI